MQIKYAYDILSNEELKYKYDSELSSNKNFYFNLGLDSDNSLNLVNLFYKKIKEIISTTEINKFINIYINKKKEIGLFDLLDFKKNFEENNIDVIRNFLTINFQMTFSLIDLWNNVPKKIIIKRESKEVFKENIIPIDIEQLYIGEGESIRINGKEYNGNLHVKINIIDKIYNDEIYFIHNSELYIIINKKRIKQDKFTVKYLDDCVYKFNIKKLKQKQNDLGIVYVKKNFGLPKYNNIDKSIIHGNLFFIFVI